MSLLVVLAVLTQASDPKPARVPLPSKPSAVAAGAEAADVKPAPPRPQEVAAPEAAILPRPDPTALDRWSDGATRRFVGSLIGSAVGAALPLVSGALAAGACPPTAPCPAWQLVGGLAAPVLAILGASLGSALMGGEPSVGAAAAGIIGGLALAAVILFADLALSFSPGTAPRWPIVAGASAAAVGLSVLAMESRHEALEKAPFLVAPAVRVAATSLALLGTLAVEALVVFGLASGGRISSAGAGIAVTVLVVAGLGATPLVPIAVHHALGGRGASAPATWAGRRRSRLAASRSLGSPSRSSVRRRTTRGSSACCRSHSPAAPWPWPSACRSSSSGATATR